MCLSSSQISSVVILALSSDSSDNAKIISSSSNRDDRARAPYSRAGHWPSTPFEQEDTAGPHEGPVGLFRTRSFSAARGRPGGPRRNAAVRWSWDDAPIQSLTNPRVCVRLRRSPWTSRFGRHDSSAAAALTRRLVGSAILRPGASLRTWDTVVTESPVRTATSRKVGSRCGILASFRHYRATSTPGLVDPPLARPSVAAWSPLRSLGSSDTVYGLGTVAKWTL